jgi:hypothetical protein
MVGCTGATGLLHVQAGARNPELAPLGCGQGRIVDAAMVGGATGRGSPGGSPLIACNTVSVVRVCVWMLQQSSMHDALRALFH